MRTLQFLKFNLLILLMVPASSFLISCRGGTLNQMDETKQTQVDDSRGMPIATFEKTVHDFGKVFSGEVVTYAFKVANTGNAPLIILDTHSGCICTVGDFTLEPIPPGEEGRIRVKFNSAGRRGFLTESVRVITNAEPQEQILQIRVEVIEQ